MNSDFEKELSTLIDRLDALDTLTGKTSQPKWKTAAAAAAVAAAVVSGVFIYNSSASHTPQDTFTDPLVARAEVERAFSIIGKRLSDGKSRAMKAEEMLDKPQKILNSITNTEK